MVVKHSHMEIEFGLDEIKKVAAKVYGRFAKTKVWVLKANMGSGKTTFIKALCEILAVSDTVSSPTYSIINEYESAEIGTIYHMDWYRLKDSEEALQAGVGECLESGSFCLIEWPEKAPDLLPDNYLEIQLSVVSEGIRRLKIADELSKSR